MDVLLRFWWFKAVVRVSTCLVCFFEDFRWFEIATNNRHLSDRATRRCSRCTSSFSPFVVCLLQCSPWSRRADFEAAASLAWPSPCTCPLTQCFALGAPQFDAPHVCTVLSHVSSVNFFYFYIVSARCKLCSSCLIFQIVFNSFFLLDFLLCQVVPVFFLGCCEVLLCLSLNYFFLKKKLFADDLRWFGVFFVCCGIL